MVRSTLDTVRCPTVRMAANIKNVKRTHVRRVKPAAMPAMTGHARLGILCMGASLLWGSGLFGDNP